MGWSAVAGGQVPSVNKERRTPTSFSLMGLKQPHPWLPVPASSPTAISCCLTHVSVHDHVTLFFSMWLSIYSVVNAKWHLRLICGIWFWLCHFGQEPSLLEGPVYISVSGVHLMTWQPPSFPDLNPCVSTGSAGRLGKYGPLCSHVRLQSASLVDNGWTEWVKQSLDMTRFTYLDPTEGKLLSVLK